MSTARLLRKTFWAAKDGLAQVAALPQVAQDVGTELANALGLPGQPTPAGTPAAPPSNRWLSRSHGAFQYGVPGPMQGMQSKMVWGSAVPPRQPPTDAGQSLWPAAASSVATDVPVAAKVTPAVAANVAQHATALSAEVHGASQAVAPQAPSPIVQALTQPVPPSAVRVAEVPRQAVQAGSGAVTATGHTTSSFSASAAVYTPSSTPSGVPPLVRQPHGGTGAVAYSPPAAAPVPLKAATAPANGMATMGGDAAAVPCAPRQLLAGSGNVAAGELSGHRAAVEVGANKRMRHQAPRPARPAYDDKALARRVTAMEASRESVVPLVQPATAQAVQRISQLAQADVVPAVKLARPAYDDKVLARRAAELEMSTDAALQLRMPHVTAVPAATAADGVAGGAGGAGGRYKRDGKAARGSGDSVQLNRRIMAASSTGELLALVRSRGPQLDYFNISSALARVPKLLPSPAALSFGGHAPSFSGHAPFSTSASAHCSPSEARHTGPAAWSSHTPSHQASHPQSAPLDAAGCAVADELAALTCRQIDTFDARGLANSAWSFGKLAARQYLPDPILPAILAAAALPKLNEFTPQHLANLTWSFAHLRWRDERLLDALVGQLSLRAHEFGPQELSNMLWALATLEVAGGTGGAMGHMPGGTGGTGHLSPAGLTPSSGFAGGGNTLPRTLAEALSLNVASSDGSTSGDPNGHTSGTLSRALEAAGLQAVELAGRQQQHFSHASGGGGGFKEQELANTLWSFARLRHYSADLYQTLVGQAEVRMHQLMPQAVSNIAWAVATAGHGGEGEGGGGSFLAAVAAHCSPQVLRTYDAQGIANVAWAMAVQGVYRPSFMDAASRRLISLGPQQVGAQNLTNMLWACATLGHRDSSMNDAWVGLTFAKLDEFGPQALSNTSWALSRLDAANGRLFDAMAAVAVSQMHLFTSQGLSMMAGAYATAQHVHVALFDAIADRAVQLLTAGGGTTTVAVQHCSMLAWAFATARHAHPALFNAAVAHVASAVAARGVQCVEPQNLANLLWACARMGHLPPPQQALTLLQAVHQLLPSSHPLVDISWGVSTSSDGRTPHHHGLGDGNGSGGGSSMGQQEVCNSLWALAALQLLDVATFGAFCERLPTLVGLNDEGLHQAFHAQLMLHSTLSRTAATSDSSSPASCQSSSSDSLSSVPPAPLPLLPEPLLSVAHGLWSAAARDVTTSRLQRDVSACLHSAGVTNALEWATDDGLFSIDIGLEVNKVPVAVEVDGPHHYSTNVPHVPLNDVAVRRRLLEDRGWQVVNLGFLEWQSLGRSLQEQARGVLGRIAQALGTDMWHTVTLPVRDAGGTRPPAVRSCWQVPRSIAPCREEGWPHCGDHALQQQQQQQFTHVHWGHDLSQHQLQQRHWNQVSHAAGGSTWQTKDVQAEQQQRQQQHAMWQQQQQQQQQCDIWQRAQHDGHHIFPQQYASLTSSPSAHSDGFSQRDVLPRHHRNHHDQQRCFEGHSEWPNAQGHHRSGQRQRYGGWGQAVAWPATSHGGSSALSSSYPLYAGLVSVVGRSLRDEDEEADATSGVSSGFALA